MVGERVPLERGRQEREAEDVDGAHADDDGERRDERAPELGPERPERGAEGRQPRPAADVPHERDEPRRDGEPEEEPCRA